jgi:hypothetical protein
MKTRREYRPKLPPNDAAVAEKEHLTRVAEAIMDAERLAGLCQGCYCDPCECLPDDCNCDPE